MTWCTCLFIFACLFQAINVTGLSPHTAYTVWLSAFTEAGEGPSAEFTVQTDEDGNGIIALYGSFVVKSDSANYALN